MEGSRLGNYRILSELGSGATAKVFLAEVAEPAPGLTVGDRVAVKVIHPHLLATKGFFKRILREVEVGRSIRHENVVRTFDLDYDEVDGRTHHFLVMEYAEGQNLRSLLAELSWLPEDLCRHIGREVARALVAIHKAGIVHRDLKPENVIIAGEDQVKLMDLGVALIQDEAIRLSQLGQFVGSVLYAAPEQFRKGGREVDHRTDLYALGLLLYELVNGHHPFQDDDIRVVMRRQLTEDPRPPSESNPQISPFLEDLILSLLTKDMAQRFPDAQTLVETLTDGEESAWWHRRSGTIRTRVKRPRRIRIPRDTALFGREKEMEWLFALWDEVRRGEGRVVILEGEAGIGKSRLVDEFSTALVKRGEDLHFLCGAYPPGGAATAAAAFSSAFREQFGLAGLEETLRPYLRETPVLIPAFAALLRGEPAPRAAEPFTKDSLQTVFVHAARALARECPTLVLVDDLHFAPEAGRALFAALALAVPGHPLLLVGTARSSVPEEWLTSLDRLEHISRMELGRLGPRGLQLLLTEALRSERLARGLGASIAMKSDGNPFFVFEILRVLREERIITMEGDGTWVASSQIRDIQIPYSVLDMVQARIAKLDEEERDLLDMAACAGFEFDPVLVAEALERGRIPVLKRLSQLERAHRIVHSVGRKFIFDHHQVQEALYGSLPDLLREEYHAALGAALEARSGAADRPSGELPGPLAVELCTHMLLGGLEEGARSCLEPALAHLENSHSNEAAAKLADLALDREGQVTGADRVELLLRKAGRLDLLGWWEEEEQTLAEAVSLAERDGDSELRARALAALGGFLNQTSRYDRALEVLREAVEMAAAGGLPRVEGPATGTMGNICRHLGRFEEARAHHERHLEIARETGDRLNEAKAMGNLAHLLQVLGTFEEARTQYERCLQAFREIGSRRGEAVATGNLGALLQEMGRHDDARAMHERHLDLTQEIGYRVGEAVASGNLGSLLFAGGRYGEALERQVRHVEILGEIGDRHGRAVARGHLGVTLMRLGAAEEARERWEEALAVFREVGNLRWEGYALLHLGQLAEQSGEEAAAEKHLLSAIETWRGIGLSYPMPDARIALGRLRISQGQLEQARDELGKAREAATDLEAPDTVLRASAYLALLGEDTSEALALLDRNEGEMVHDERIETRYVLFRATGDRAHLKEADRLVRECVGHSPASYRESMVERVPMFREIQKAMRT